MEKELNKRQERILEKAGKYSSFLDYCMDDKDSYRSGVVEDDGTLHISMYGIRLCFDIGSYNAPRKVAKMEAQLVSALKKVANQK